MTFSFFPRTIYQAKSKISGEIVVREHFGQRKLYVQGVLQSGGIIKDLWKRPIRKISNFQFPMPNVLILGLGGGTAVQIIKQHWPKAKITAIEIDPEIIKIGKKFFGLGEVENLKIIQADAIGWICAHDYNDVRDQPRIKDFSNISGSRDRERRQETRGVFDLVLVDLYLGKEFPKRAESDQFFKYLKKLLAPKGVVIFNRLRQRGEEFPQFEKKIKKHFSLQEKIKTSSNLFFIAVS